MNNTLEKGQLVKIVNHSPEWNGSRGIITKVYPYSSTIKISDSTKTFNNNFLEPVKVDQNNVINDAYEEEDKQVVITHKGNPHYGRVAYIQTEKHDYENNIHGTEVKIEDKVYLLKDNHYIPLSKLREAFINVDREEVKSHFNTQEGGDHYKGFAIEPSEYIQKNKLDWCEGNIIKYATRHRQKNGAEDIRKIIHYANLLLELEYND